MLFVKKLIQILLILILSITFVVAKPDRNANFAFVIVIQTSESKKTLIRLESDKKFVGYNLYQPPIAKSDKFSEEVRIGFFSSKKSAQRIFDKLPSELALHSKIDNMSSADEKQLMAWLRISDLGKSYSITNSLKDKRIKKIEILMERARLAMIQHDYRIAIANYTKVISYEEESFKQNALEYLGLARERNLQYAHAKAEYEKYLKLYPESDGAERVKNRLTAMLTAAMKPKGKLRKAKSRKSDLSWRGYGGAAQYYRRDVNVKGGVGDNILSSNAYSSLFYTTRLKKSTFSVINRISLSHNMDFNNSEDAKDVRISSLYSEFHSKRFKTSSKVGRQSENASGVYGRFDGAVLGYHINPKLTTRIIAGFPVDFNTYQTIQTEKRFYSINFEMDSIFKNFDFIAYFIQQTIEEITDRQAIGMELRHFDRLITFYSILDYDTQYHLLNNLITNIRYQIQKKTQIGLHLDFRRSPLISTSNALQGQATTSLSELLQSANESEIKQLARDRTAKYAAVTSSVQYKFSKHVNFNNDYTISRFSSTPASGGVAATEGTGYEHFVSSQIISTDFFRQYDVTILGLRYAKLFSSDRYTLNLLRRDPIRGNLTLSINSRMDYQIRKDDSTLLSFRPSIKTNYKFNKKLKLEFETGFDYRIREHGFDEGKEIDTFFSIGYFAQF